MSLEWRQLATTIASSLLVRPAVLAAWVAALAVVLVGGSLFVFLVKGGTVGILARGERHAGPIERPPLMLESIGRASAFSIDSFIECATGLFPRYARLGVGLEGGLSGVGQCLPRAARANSGDSGWGVAALLTAAFVAWITARQPVLPADADRDCSGRLLRRCRHHARLRVSAATDPRRRWRVPDHPGARRAGNRRLGARHSGALASRIRAVHRPDGASASTPGVGAARPGLSIHRAGFGRRLFEDLSHGIGRASVHPLAPVKVS